MKTNEIICGDALKCLKTMPDQGVHCCVTSPPYWGLRDYGTEPQVWGGDSCCDHQWKTDRYYVEGGGGAGSSAEAFSRPGKENAERIKKARWREDDTCCKCGAWKGSLGLEPTPDMYVSHLVEIFRELRRVLRDDGTLWLNLGDSYAGLWGNAGHRKQIDGGESVQRQRDSEYIHRKGFDNHRTAPPSSNAIKIGLKPKDLVGIPWRVAFALQADGWYLRSDIIWHKPNPMPESVTDRPTKSHEYIFLMSKKKKYWYDATAIKETVADSQRGRIREDIVGGSSHKERGQHSKGGTYKITSRSSHGSRFDKGKTAEHQLGRAQKGMRIHGNKPGRDENGAACNRPGQERRNKRSVWTVVTTPYPGPHYAVFPEELIIPCIKAGCPEGGTVIDPFFGRGTTGLVAVKLERRYVGIELNSEDCKAAEKRIQDKMGLFL